MQLAAVSKSPYAIKYIDNPTSKVELTAKSKGIKMKTSLVFDRSSGILYARQVGSEEFLSHLKPLEGITIELNGKDFFGVRVFDADKLSIVDWKDIVVKYQDKMPKSIIKEVTAWFCSNDR